MSNACIWPDYNNCLANLPNSILKKLGAEPAGDSLPLLDKYLEKDYKNIIVILLDGMGKSIVEKHLSPDGPFRSNCRGTYLSTFLSTTVAATTSVITGLQPCEHAWLGWDCYYPQIDKNVAVFLNTLTGTKTPAADYHVAAKFTPYKTVFERIKEAGGEAYACTPFEPPYYPDFDSSLAAVKELAAKPGKKYIYCYCPEPDGIMHLTGTASKETHEKVRELEKTVDELVSELKDSIVIVTADHGHRDQTGSARIEDYPNITDLLVRGPSFEPTVLNLFVKDGKKTEFENEFKKSFGEHFMLLRKEEVIERKLMGTKTPHENFAAMLGDYIAVSLDGFALYYEEGEFASVHAALSPDEMEIPLIIFERGE